MNKVRKGKDSMYQDIDDVNRNVLKNRIGSSENQGRGFGYGNEGELPEDGSCKQ